MNHNNIENEHLNYREICFNEMRAEQILCNPFNRPKHVQSFINNISFPKTLEELEWFIYEHGADEGT